ncbi:MAG: GNAT family N-acetyltransferase [Casimicrobiaceae bacterium]
MTILIPMRPQAFAAYREEAVAGYAEDNVVAGRWPGEGAVERSRTEFDRLLPQGLATPGNHLFEILADRNGAVVGAIWMAVEDRHGARGGYVYDVGIVAAHRRQGHATAAFRALESFAAGLGLSTLGLHVFGQNQAAQALYAHLGYQVVGINMLKHLGSR